VQDALEPAQHLLTRLGDMHRRQPLQPALPDQRRDRRLRRILTQQQGADRLNYARPRPHQLLSAATPFPQLTNRRGRHVNAHDAVAPQRIRQPLRI
jgi:hypothetical protein